MHARQSYSCLLEFRVSGVGLLMISLLNTIERSPTLRLVERQPDGTLAVHTGAQLISRCGEWSAYVERLGAPRGTAVVLPMRSSVDAVAVLLACWQHGLM